MSQDLATLAKERGIKYFLISYIDLFGSQRAKLVPAAAIADMQKDGAGFAGFATWLDMTPAHPDMFAHARSRRPHPAAVEDRRSPGSPPICMMDGKLVEQAPRNVLKKLMAEAAKDGYDVKTGVECEFFLIDAGRHQRSPTTPIPQSKPCYDQQALMRRYDVITEICDSMLELGWGPYQNDHEDANGQFEMNWEFDDAPDHRRQARLLQVHGQVDRREARAARDLHAEAVPGPDRQRLPRARLAVGQGRQERVRRRQGRARACRAGLQFHRRHHDAFGRGACRHHQSDGQFLQAHQRAAHDLGRDLVAQHGDL